MTHPVQATTLVLCTMAACLLLASAGATAHSPFAQAAEPPSGCAVGSPLPVLLPDGQRSALITQEFNPPAENWLQGHRGIDIAAPNGSTLLAPADGTLSFVGSVGGKDDLSLAVSPGTVLSFEPVVSTLKAGDKVTKGEEIGSITGHSDHCDGSCLHWGAKRQGVYVDPRLAVRPTRLVLKPVR